MSLYNTTLSQPFLFAGFVYAGVLIGLLGSLFRLLLRLFGRALPVRIFADVLFVLLSCGIFFGAALLLAELRLRAYYFIGTAAGYALYSAAIRPLAVYINCKFHKKKIDNHSRK